MEISVKEKEQMQVHYYKDYVEAEYTIPKYYSKQNGNTVINRFFADEAIKKLPEFSTWKETILEKCQKKESVYVASCVGGQLIYGFYIRLVNERGSRRKLWKLNVMVGTE